MSTTVVVAVVKGSVDTQMLERDLQAEVIETARAAGWRVHHTSDSRRARPGWPDLFLVRDGDCLVLELKTVKGVVTDKQRGWLTALDAVAGIEARVVRPTDLDNLTARLTGERPWRQAVLFDE